MRLDKTEREVLRKWVKIVIPQISKLEYLWIFDLIFCSVTYFSPVKLKLLVFFKFSLKRMFQYCLVLRSRWLIDTDNSQCTNW